MQELLLFLASGITIFAALPYLRDILKGKSKPNIVSWLTWTLLTGMAAAAQIAAHEYAAAIFTISATITTASVVVLGLKYGYVQYTMFDKWCQSAVLLGLMLWYVFDSPMLAVLAAVTIDAIGALPTIRHAWLRPTEETLLTYLLSGVGGLITIFALTSLTWTTLSYPIYIFVINTLIVTVIFCRGKVSLEHST